MIYLLNVFKDLKITQRFGMTDFAKANPRAYPSTSGQHPGIDFSKGGTVYVRAAHSGIVVVDDDIDDSGRGINVSLWNPEQRIATRYFHLYKNNVERNQRVAAGDVIGIMGNTGFSKGQHLHFGLYQVDSDGIVINKDNGLLGAIDPFGPEVVWNEFI